jgi:hypothetical protein
MTTGAALGAATLGCEYTASDERVKAMMAQRRAEVTRQILPKAGEFDSGGSPIVSCLRLFA